MIVQNRKLYRTTAHFGNLNVFCPFKDDSSDVVESWFIVAPTVCVGFVCGACSVVQYRVSSLVLKSHCGERGNWLLYCYCLLGVM